MRNFYQLNYKFTKGLFLDESFCPQSNRFCSPVKTKIIKVVCGQLQNASQSISNRGNKQVYNINSRVMDQGKAPLSVELRSTSWFFTGRQTVVSSSPLIYSTNAQFSCVEFCQGHYREVSEMATSSVLIKTLLLISVKNWFIDWRSVIQFVWDQWNSNRWYVYIYCQGRRFLYANTHVRTWKHWKALLK